jgi:hypothetical protein
MKIIRHEEGRGWMLGDYQDYLEANVGRFPPGARQFALSIWRFDFRHSQCPHDSWVESIVVKELAAGERRQTRRLEIKIFAATQSWVDSV